MNIVLVGISPLVERRKDAFYLDEMIAKGFQVIHCDLSPCYFQDLNYENVMDVDYALTFFSLSSFEEFLQKIDIDDTIFIVEVDHIDKFKDIFQMVRKYNCKCVKINPNASDFSNYHLPFYKRCKYFGLKNALAHLFLPFRQFCKNAIHGNCYNVYSLYISSGNNPQIDVHINQRDWENSRNISNSRPDINYKYAVFCDEYFPDHPDFMYAGGVDNIEKVKNVYRHEINAFFDYLESTYNLRIVIAAHPKSNYKGDEYCGRNIVRGKTMELVKDAVFSIVHGSMSISYSVIFNVPIILAITDDMLKLDYYKWQSFIYSDYFGLPVSNLSKNFYTKPILVAPSVRERYIYEFLTSPGIENKKNADILSEEFLKM